MTNGPVPVVAVGRGQCRAIIYARRIYWLDWRAFDPISSAGRMYVRAVGARERVPPQILNSCRTAQASAERAPVRPTASLLPVVEIAIVYAAGDLQYSSSRQVAFVRPLDGNVDDSTD